MPPRKPPTNKYKQVYVGPPIVKEKPKPPGPKPPPFKVGDVLHTGFRPHFFDLLQPIVALELREGISVCGWLVRVATNKGDQWLGASHFTRKPAPERGA